MKKLFEQIAFDWHHHRLRLFCETVAMISAVVFVVVFTSTADRPTTAINRFLLEVETLGCSCGVVYGVLRHSINIVFLNAVMTAFSVWGLCKFF